MAHRHGVKRWDGCCANGCLDHAASVSLRDPEEELTVRREFDDSLIGPWATRIARSRTVSSTTNIGSVERFETGE
jgi:hypothetical protein